MSGVLSYCVSTLRSQKIGEAKQKPMYTKNQVPESVDREGLLQSPTRGLQLAPAASNVVMKSNAHFDEQLRGMVEVKVRHKYAKHFYEARQQAVKKALSDHFIKGTAETGEGVKTPSIGKLKPS